MSKFELVLRNTQGTTWPFSVRLDENELWLTDRDLVSVSDDFSRLTCVTHLRFNKNSFVDVPASVCRLTQLTLLNVNQNRLARLPPAFAGLTLLKNLFLDSNELETLPREIGQMRELIVLSVDENRLSSLPSELCRLTKLSKLWLQSNRLSWIPMSLDRLPMSCDIMLNGNPLDRDLPDAGVASQSVRYILWEILQETTALAMIRTEATTLAIGLQDLELPALLTLEIVDAAFPNSIAMHKKWNLITAIKHWRQRRC